MTLVTLDIVLLLPQSLRQHAVVCSKLVADQMRAGGSASHFQLGAPQLGAPQSGDGSGDCEPHVSLFMLTVADPEVYQVVRVVDELATTLPALDAEAAEYRYNPHGAVEVYFTKSPAWSDLQRAVINSVEPLRRGRLREVDPSGARLRDLVDRSSPQDPRRQQLLRYGYDEVADAEGGGHDRFNPHITLVWPRDHDYRVALDGLPVPCSFSGRLTQLAVFGMSAYGTCTKNYGVFSLSAQKRVSSAN